MFPVIFILPTTSNVDCGFVVPIPIFPKLKYILLGFIELTINGDEPIIVPSALVNTPVFSRIILLILNVFVFINKALLKVDPIGFVTKYCQEQGFSKKKTHYY